MIKITQIRYVSTMWRHWTYRTSTNKQGKTRLNRESMLP